MPSKHAASPFGESDIAAIRRQRLEETPFDFPDVIIDGLLATLAAAPAPQPATPRLDADLLQRAIDAARDDADDAEIVARHYARLAEPHPETAE